MAERSNNSQAALNPTRRIAVRLSLATGATLATLLGAQTLALREQSFTIAGSNTNTPSEFKSTLQSTAAPSATLPSTATTVVTIAPTNLPPAPPKLTIIRNQGVMPTPVPIKSNSTGSNKQPSQPSQNSNNVNSGSFAPPNAVVDAQAAAPAVQPAQSQPQPVTKSSK